MPDSFPFMKNREKTFNYFISFNEYTVRILVLIIKNMFIFN